MSKINAYLVVDCLFLDDGQGVWNPTDGYHKFKILAVNDDEASEVRKEVLRRLNSINEELADVMAKPFEADPSWCEEQHNWEYARYLNGGHAPMCDAWGNYYQRKPLNLTINEGDDTIYFKGQDAPKVTGAEVGENLYGRRGRIKFHLEEYDRTGNVVAKADYLDLDPINV